MADRHQRGAKDHSAALAEYTVGKPASKKWGEINKPGIETINLRGERLHADRTEQAFERAARQAKPNYVAMAGQQKIFYHIKNEQRAHSVKRKALPHLGGKQEGQAARMAEEIAPGRRDVIDA